MIVVSLTAFNALCIVGSFKYGVYKGVNTSTEIWHSKLISAEFAEYDRKTGVWKLKTLDEVLMTGTILGKGPNLGFIPEPELSFAEVDDIKKRFKTKLVKK